MDRNYNIGVVGCGPAGLALSLLLKRDGHEVTCYERFDEPQPVGSGLMIQPTGLAVFDHLGLAKQIVSHGMPIDALLGLNQNGETALDARYADLRHDTVFGIGIHRASLFSILHDAATKAGVVMHFGCETIASSANEDNRWLTFSDGQHSEHHDLIVDASGTSSKLAPPTGRWLDYGALWATLKWPKDAPFDQHLLEQRYRLAREMVGVLPIGTRPGGDSNELAFFWSLRADKYSQWQSDGLDAWKQAVLDLWPECDVLLDQLTDPEQITFARYAHRTVKQPVAHRMVHIGDAWHSASPQLGQGANMAMLDAFALASSLQGQETLPQQLNNFRNLRSRHVHLYQALTSAFTPAYQSDSVWPAVMRDFVLAPAGRIPPAPSIQARLVSGLVGNPLGRLGLSMPDYSALKRFFH